MGYAGAYLWRLRQAIGQELELMPGAMIAAQDASTVAGGGYGHLPGSSVHPVWY